MAFYISPPPRNPLTSLLTALVGGIILVGAFFLGFVFLAVAIAVAVVAWLVIVIRVKWMTRKMRKQGIDPFAPYSAPQQKDQDPNTVVEAEYTVVSREVEK